MLNILHFIFWFLIFNIGVFELLGLPTAFHKIAIPTIGLILFSFTALKNGVNTKFPFIKWVLLFIGCALVSKFLNGSAYFSLFIFLSYTLIPYFYLVVIINEKNVSRTNIITKWIRFLILIQIPASIIKFFIIGQSEKGAIGTLSVGLGSFSTVFPVLIIAFLISFYLFFDKIKYIFLVLLYIIFGIIGLKRAITFIIPLEFVVSFILYLAFFVKKRKPKQLQKLGFVSVMGLIVFYFMVRTNPTLNREHSSWGSFDLEYLMNYSESYSSSEGKTRKEMRRKDGLIYFLNYNLSSPLPNLLFGDGAGILIGSNYDKKSGGMESLYGVRYGGRMGVIWLLLQVGLLGLIIYLGLLITIVTHIVKRSFIKNNYLLLGFCTASIFMFFDTIIYSNTFIAFEVVKCIYFYIAALLLIQIELVKRNNKEVKLLYVNTMKV